MNKIGDQTSPCDTPAITGYKEDSGPFATTNKYLLDKHDVIREKAF